MSEQIINGIISAGHVYEIIRQEQSLEVVEGTIRNYLQDNTNSKLIVNMFHQLLIQIEKANEKGILICNILQFNSILSQNVIQIFLLRYLHLILMSHLDIVDLINILKIIFQVQFNKDQPDYKNDQLVIILNASLQIVNIIDQRLIQIKNAIQVFEVQAKYLEQISLFIQKNSIKKDNLTCQQLNELSYLLEQHIDLIKRKTVQIISQKQLLFLADNQQFILNKYQNVIYCHTLLIILHLFLIPNINHKQNNDFNNNIFDHLTSFWKYIQITFCKRNNQINIFAKISQFFMLQNDSLFNSLLSIIIQNNLVLQTYIKNWNLKHFIQTFDQETLLNLSINDSSLSEMLKQLNQKPNSNAKEQNN